MQGHNTGYAAPPQGNFSQAAGQMPTSMAPQPPLTTTPGAGDAVVNFSVPSGPKDGGDDGDREPNAALIMFYGILIGFFLDVLGLFFMCCACCCAWVPKMQDNRRLRNRFMYGWGIGFVLLAVLNALLYHFIDDFGVTWWTGIIEKIRAN